MTIRNRLTWLFVGVVAFILLGVLTTAFLLQADYSRREFRQRRGKPQLGRWWLGRREHRFDQPVRQRQL